jgi:Tfp pilus assembly protein PilV
MVLIPPGPHARRARRAAGFSLVEALIAAAVLGFIAIGILPLFTQAMVNNKQGSDSTTVTTFSKTNVENLDSQPFASTNLTVPVGSTSLVTVDWYVQASSQVVGGTNASWIVTCTGTASACAGTTPPAGQGLVLWKRTTTVQQYNVSDLAFANPEDGGTASDFVHLKSVKVVVQRPNPGMSLNSGKAVTLQLLRAD